MKKNLFFILLLLLSSKFCSQLAAQNLEDPGSYMNAISNAHEEMNKKYMTYVSAAAHGRRARKVEKLRQQVLESITNSRYTTTDLPIYKGDNTLRQSSIDYIQMCYNIFNEDYGKIVNTEEIAEQSFDQMQAYILLQEKTSEKLEEAFNKMHTADLAFAAKYKVTIVNAPKDELSEKMSVAGKLNHYHNQIYLLFFKCNWEDGEVTKAITNKKVNDIEQSRNALIRYADEGLKALDTCKGFEGDMSLVATCKQALQFYKKYAEKDIPKITDYFLKQENFEKMKKSFENKSESSRTKEDVDNFNKSVKEINNAVNTYNQSNDQLNKSRHEMIENWNSTENSFNNTHMPYYKG